MMMAAGAESPSVATQSAKTDILQKIGQRGNAEEEENQKEENPENISDNGKEALLEEEDPIVNDEDEDNGNDATDLRVKNDLLQMTLLRVQCESDGEKRRLARELQEKDEVLQQLRRQLEEQSDYKELQQQARILRSQLVKSTEDTTSPGKTGIFPDFYALQQMKALQLANNNPLKSLLNAGGVLPWLRPPNMIGPPVTSMTSTENDGGMAKFLRQNLLSTMGKSELPNFGSAKDQQSLTRSSTPNTNEPCSPPPTLMPPPAYQQLGSESNRNRITANLLTSGRIPKADPMEGQLQDMLHYNMERCAGQALDTAGTSRRVRELLSSHNIGQRLFAKYVLGLSQGTVSELLSKPKMWEKLTEKGRDSYRKMHAWAYDENAVLLLKSLIPRKGELMRSASSPRSLAQTLRDKSRQMQSPHHPPTPPSMVPVTKDFLSLHHERLAFEANQQSQRDVESPQDLSSSSNLMEKEEDNDSKSEGAVSPPSTPKSAASGSNRPPPPLIPFTSKSGTGNPLQQMATITNSLTALPPPPLSSPTSPMSFRNNGGSASAAAAAAAAAARTSNKMALPPISQEQFDKYSHINTELLVRKVKECLSQNSISQRLFGECVLGLSQGSVSDLLTRPKPWHMLTQKGKEPFIRMQMFADDPDAVKRLMASQYRVAPERLMRSGNFPNPSFPFYPMGNQVKPPKTSPTQFLGSSMSRLFPEPLNERMFPGPAALFQDFLLRPPVSVPNSAAVSALFGAAAAGLPMQDQLPPQELDTVAITTKVKEKLAAFNLGQKVFGEAVLGLSQGSVSEYLCKPKPWSMLSAKGREPYIKMQIWLEDPDAVDKLRLWENGENTRKRRSSSSCPSPSESPPISEKKAKLQPPNFDLFKLWFHQQNPLMAAALQAQQNQANQENLEDNKSDCSEKGARRKSATPQQYLAGSQDEATND